MNDILNRRAMTDDEAADEARMTQAFIAGDQAALAGGLQAGGRRSSSRWQFARSAIAAMQKTSLKKSSSQRGPGAQVSSLNDRACRRGS